MREVAGAGVVVALSTRVPEGPVLPVYGNGGGADLVAAGASRWLRLPASQARSLLALLLAALPDPAVGPRALGRPRLAATIERR